MNELEPVVTETVGKIVSNMAELNKTVDAMLKKYDGLVYTDDEIPAAKKDRAYLNTQFKVIDSERKRVKKAYSAPLVEFESQVKEVTDKITSVSGKIDSQVKDFEAMQKEQKRKKIEAWWAENGDKNVPFSRVFDPSFLNKTASDDYWQSILRMSADRFKKDLVTLCNLDDEAARNFTIADYQHTLDISQTMANWTAEKERRAQAEAIKAQYRKPEPEAKPEPVKAVEKPAEVIPAEDKSGVVTRIVQIKGTLEQLRELMAWCNEHGVYASKVDF